jgi:hypothetical protein
MQEKYLAGDNIVSYCTKCRLNLDHTIVAMTGEAIVKVKCRTCGSTHKFRDPANAPKARPAKAGASRASRPMSEDRWEAALAEAKGQPHPYNREGKYRVGDVVAHDRFGKGVVLKLYTNKCDVLFQDQERLMASGN